ncbi:MAG TPA: LPS assembly protein LptD [Dongiaceae bacterium]|nr:LPS assembly protein LptD [Dongiaceae bacterium]
MRASVWTIALGAWGLGLLGAAIAQQTTSPQSQPASSPNIEVHADEFTHESELHLYIARGHAELISNGNIVKADMITYNEAAKTVSASGNVVILEPNGDTIFGTYANVTDNLDDGQIENFRALLKDQSRIAASHAERHKHGDLNTLDQTAYTPCLPCKDHPKRPPIWQIKSRHVVQDKINHVYTYRNAWIEMFGVPVIYTPYFEHPDSTVSRKSGFLLPGFSYSKASGFQAREPYFLTLGDSADLTITPILRIEGEPGNDEGAVGLIEYRQRVTSGRFRLAGSGTSEDRYSDTFSNKIIKDTFRGHVEGDGQFDINDDWRWGFNFKNATDKRYLRRYHFQPATWLQDRLFTEGFFGRSYATAEALGYQTTAESLNDYNAPIVAPSLRYNYVGEPLDNGSYFGLNLDTLNIRRRRNVDLVNRITQPERQTFRFSAIPTWTLPYTGPIGDIYTLVLSAEATGYKVSNVDRVRDSTIPLRGDEEFDGFTGRLFPKASFDWRWPLTTQFGSVTHILEPEVQVVGSRNCCNTNRIPNEDSRSFELDETRIFDRDRFPGLDRADSGSRVTYGMNWTAYGWGKSQAGLFAGQSYQFERTPGLRPNSGIDAALTDIVGKANYRWDQYVDLTYRFRVDPRNDFLARQDVTATVGIPEFSVSGTYLFLGDEESSPDQISRRRSSNLTNVEQVNLFVNSQITDNWNIHGNIWNDIRNDRILLYGAGVRYQDECFGLGLDFSHSSVQQTIDNEGGTTFLFYLYLKNIGTISNQL